MALNLPVLLALSFVLLLMGAFTCLVTVFFMAQSLLRPPRLTDGKALYLLRRLAPDDLGMAYEPLQIPVRDEATGRTLKLAAWWIPADTVAGKTRDGCAVLIHSYADAKVGALAWAPLWHEIGFNLLIPDLRAHGESAGTFCTGGFFERHDIVQMINQLRTDRPAEIRQIVLFGASVGAAVALATADAMDASSVAAVVVDTPIQSFDHAARAHFARTGMPNGWLLRASLRLAENLSQADFGHVRPVDLIRRLSCPIMAIYPAEDAYYLPGDAEAISDALAERPAHAGPDACWRFNSCEHLMAIVNEPNQYRDRVGAFLQGAIRPTPVRSRD